MSNLNLNKVIIAGRLTADPELKQTQSGISVVTFTVAVNRQYSKDEQKQKEADFLNVTAWRTTADFVARYFKKGSAICVCGSLRTRSYTAQDGSNRHVTEIMADDVMFVDSKDEATGTGTQPGSAGYIPPAYTQSNSPKFEELKTDDDLPF